MNYSGLLRLVDYLNKNNFSISISDVEKLYKFIVTEDVNLTNNEDFEYSLILFFAKNKTQRARLPKLLEKFILNFEEIKKLENEKKSNKDNYEKKISKLNSEYKKIENSDDETEKLKANFVKNVKAKLSSQEQKLLSKDFIEKLENANLSNTDIEKEQKRLTKEMENALSKGNMKKFELIMKLIKNLDRIKSQSTKLKSSLKDKEHKLSEIKKKISEEKNKHKKIQEEIDELLKEKESSENNRDDLNFKGSVKVKAENYNNYTNISDLSNNELYLYIKENKNKFITKFSKSISNNKTNKIDMKETILSACKTGGIPFVIKNEVPIKRKPNLFLVLDVSGSCISAARTMLNLMYYFQSLFRGGVYSYAFVNSLYDISEIMKSDNIDTASQNVFSKIPTKGVYSNYSVPIQEFWKNNESRINKESVVIFIGDARNNRNPSEEDTIKKIANKANKAFWLNTEDVSKWGIKDSIANIYNKYFTMFQTVTLEDIENFFNNI